MYTNRDKQQILDDMLEGVRSDVDKREGSIVHDMLAPPAEEIEMLGFALDAILENGFLDTAQAQYIDRRAAEYGITRKQAERAKGWLLFKGKKNTEIPIGTEVIADSEGELIALQTVEYAVIDENGEVTVRADAVVGGLIGNIAADSELSIQEPPNVEVTNPVEFLNGVDIEPDEELKSRTLMKIRKPITSGNVYHYELWAREVEGISQARVLPLWNGPGTVKVIVINSEGKAPTEEQVTAVYEHIDTERPIGADVTVVAINEVPVNVSATLVLLNGLISSDVQKAVEDSIANYLSEAGTTIRHSRIASAVLKVEGVRDYDNLLIGTDELGVANIMVSTNDVAVVGEVILS